MKASELKELVRSTIRENFMNEMSQGDIHFKAIIKFYDKGTSNVKKALSLFLCGKPNANRSQIVKELLEMDYKEIQDVMKHFKLKTEAILDKKHRERVIPNDTQHVATSLPQTQEVEPDEEKLHNEGNDCGCK